MIPFFSNTNNFEYPLSGDVTQDISPSFFAAQAGVPEIEREVVTKIASYGDQIGALMEVVLLLVDADDDRKEVEELRRISEKVKSKKDEMRAIFRHRAEAALARLEKADKASYAALVNTLTTKG